MSMKNSYDPVIHDSVVLNFKCLCRAAMSFCIPEGLPVTAVEKDVLIEF
jgi:hypothetical protein